MAMHKMIGRMHGTAIKSIHQQLYLDGMEYLRQECFCGVVVTTHIYIPAVQSAFRGAENEQGLVAWELATSHLYISCWCRPLHADFLRFYLSNPQLLGCVCVCDCVN